MVFKNVKAYWISSIFIFWALTKNITTNFAMEVMQTHINPPNIENYHDAINALHELKNPFTKSDKENVLEASGLYTKDPLLDKGLLQVYVQIINHPKKDAYLYYKLVKYALAIFIKLEELKINSQNNILYCDSNTGNVCYGIIKNINSQNKKHYYFINNFTYQSWQKIYKIIQTTPFNNTEQIGTIGLKLALLLDIQNIRHINYLTNITWNDIHNLYNGSIQYIKQTCTLPVSEEVLYIDSLLTCFTADDGRPFNFTKIKLWSKRDENFIIPTFNTYQNKNFSPTGLIPIIFSIIHGCCLLHFSIKPSTSHNNELKALVDYIFHDLNHYYIQANNAEGNGKPTPGRTYFFTKTKKILKSIVRSYNKNTINQKNNALQLIFALFFILHEIKPHSKAYDNPKKRISFKKCLDYYFFGSPFDPTLDLNLVMPQEKYQDILFTFKDMETLYKNIDPESQNKFPSLGNKENLDNNTPTFKKIFSTIATLQLCMLNLLHKFYFQYQNKYRGTIPLLVSNLNEIKVLKKLAELS
ncbi:hypothetical protein EKK58_06445 [Candidatus Dependentiae bacterium]|nr:MAG: hypothetical protein EKK58_06445 [Candidatus Dependentiae bacterium]